MNNLINMDFFLTFNSKEAQDVGFEQLAEIIRSDEELKKNTLIYRDLLAQGNEKAAKAVKESTPQVAVSFRMEGGKGKDCCRECLHQVMVDFDAKAPGERLPAGELEKVKTFMRTSYHALFGYESISGLGYHIVVPFILPDGITIDMTADPKRAAEYGLINIDELDKMNDRQLNKLKSMITTTDVDVRAPFGRHKEKRVRVATYAASGNKEEFLTDQTGNRRWLPFHVTAIDSPYEHTLPYDGMFAQALYLLQSGFNYWFDLDDIQSLEQHVETFMIPTSEEELIPIYFSPARLEDAGSKFLTLAEISAKIVAFGNLKKNPEPRRLGAIMTKLGFTKERKGHDKRRGYYVREHIQSEIEQMHQPDVF